MGKAPKKSDLRKAVAQAIEFLNKYFDIEEAILFGSQVSGKVNEFSDVDLAIISPDFKGKSYEEILKVFCDLALKYGPRVELRPYTPDDLKSARPTNFLGFILKTGKVIYKKGKFLL